MAVQTGDRNAAPNHPPRPPRRFDRAGSASPRRPCSGSSPSGSPSGSPNCSRPSGQWTGWLGTASSPIAALGSAFIDLTPEWLKEWAIRTFGQNDKTALRIGMLVTVAIAAALIGVVGRWRPRVGVGLAGLLLVVAAIAVLTRANSSVVDLLPLVIGAAVGLWVLVAGLRFGLGVRGTAAASDPAPVATPAPVSPAESVRSTPEAGQDDVAGKVVLHRCGPPDGDRLGVGRWVRPAGVLPGGSGWARWWPWPPGRCPDGFPVPPTSRPAVRRCRPSCRPSSTCRRRPPARSTTFRGSPRS